MLPLPKFSDAAARGFAQDTLFGTTVVASGAKQSTPGSHAPHTLSGAILTVLVGKPPARADTTAPLRRLHLSSAKPSCGVNTVTVPFQNAAD